MGKNTPDRQEFIIDSLKVEVDWVEEVEEIKEKAIEESETKPVEA